MKAKYTFMTKQVDSLTELRKKMEEQNRDLQKQLNLERDEKKSLQKRLASLFVVDNDDDDDDDDDDDFIVIVADDDVVIVVAGDDDDVDDDCDAFFCKS